MAIKLHRCSLMWFKVGAHPCWRVQSALDDKGIEYEVVTGPLRRGKREDVKRLTGQAAYPVIEFEDGTAYREESADMAERIRADRLFEGRAQTPPAPGAPTPPPPGAPTA